MYIKREITKHVTRLAKQYPIVTITGPRQSGKTTLARQVFKNYTYVTLESPDNRRRSIADPRSFLDSIGDRAIIDEVQRVPNLLSYMQEYVDTKNTSGMYILTGSAQFELLDTISQSLAGRSAIVHLLPFSLSEAYGTNIPDIGSVLYTGFYPRIFDKNLNPSESMSFYTATYLERDVRNLAGVRDLNQFETFLKLCAGRTGQLVNQSSLSSDIGISHTTVNNWLSILRTSFVIHLLRPHFRNFSKRLVKSPKLHFFDCGLVSYLLDITNSHQIPTHPLLGALFESFVIGELAKIRYNSIKALDLYYWRDSAGHELDCLIDRGTMQIPVEIKAGKTVNTDFFKNIEYYRNLNPQCQKGILVYGGDSSYHEQNTLVLSFRDLASLRDLDNALSF